MDRNEVLDKFFRENYNKLCKKVARRAGTPENTEDIVQEAFCRALQYWDTYIGAEDEVGPWFGVLLENTLKDFKSEERRLGMPISIEEADVGGKEMPETEDNILAHVTSLMEEKSGNTYKALDLYLNKGYRCKDVANILGLSEAAIRKSVKKFKRRLRENLAEQQ